MAYSGDRSRYAWATPLTMLVAPGPRVDMQMPGLPVISPQVEASMAPATSCFISRNRIWRWRAASISSTDSPPGCPTMKGVPASLNADASTSTVVDIRAGLPEFCSGSLPPGERSRLAHSLLVAMQARCPRSQEAHSGPGRVGWAKAANANIRLCGRTVYLVIEVRDHGDERSTANE